MRAQLQQLLENRVQQCVSNQRITKSCPKIANKKESLSKRSAEIVKARALGKIHQTNPNNPFSEVFYTAHFQYLIEQNGFLYLEEEVEQRRAEFQRDVIISDEEVVPTYSAIEQQRPKIYPEDQYERVAYSYNRLKAVQYAEKWWNSYNPAYKKFKDDCTNFISQCLHQGGGPMRGQPNRSRGWWMAGNNWSYSWSVANALRLYLANSKEGLRTREVSSPDQLLFGDIICYDFEGDGRFNHNTIITGKDAFGMPLVNAHTTNSRMRYWSYEDSSAYTPNIKYKFFTIVDDR
jgi:hypothetical protein